MDIKYFAKRYFEDVFAHPKYLILIEADTVDNIQETISVFQSEQEAEFFRLELKHLIQEEFIKTFVKQERKYGKILFENHEALINIYNWLNDKQYLFNDNLSISSEFPKITLGDKIIEDIHRELLPFFNKEDHAKLLCLLKGKSIVNKITFNSSINKLADAFRRLKEAGKIQETKKTISNWIAINFQYVKKGEIAPVDVAYLEKCIEINSNERCKRSIPYFREYYKFSYEEEI